jgi:hypothetical protein
MMIERNVGIVGDGATDLEIFKKLVDCILSGSHTNYVELERQTLRDHIDKYWSAASSSNAYYLPAKHALTLQNEVTNVLDGAFFCSGSHAPAWEPSSDAPASSVSSLWFPRAGVGTQFRRASVECEFSVLCYVLKDGADAPRRHSHAGAWERAKIDRFYLIFFR